MKKIMLTVFVAAPLFSMTKVALKPHAHAHKNVVSRAFPYHYIKLFFPITTPIIAMKQ